VTAPIPQGLGVFLSLMLLDPYKVQKPAIFEKWQKNNRFFAIRGAATA